jgi:YVTN family beta-propeller protein
MIRGRIAVLSMALAGLLSAAVPALASARVAYFTGGGEQTGGGYAAPVDVGTQITGAAVSISGGEGSPPDVAITPDGSTAYVPNGNHAVIPIAIPTNTAGTPIATGFEPWGIAIAPDGKSAYVANRSEDTVSKIDLPSGTVTATLTVGASPVAVAIAPDGKSAYVANEADDTVSVISLATDVVGPTITVGNGPSGVAVTPDGSRAYVINRNDETISVINVATNTLIATIAAVEGNTLAIDPAGTHAFAVEVFPGSLTPIDLAANSAGAPIPVANFPEDVAILPDGTYAFITASGSGKLLPFNTATSTLGTPFNIGENPGAIAIVPNQPPHAAFTSTSPAPKPSVAIAFDASGSTDLDGTVTRFDWDFGDGTVVQSAGAKPSHTYAKAGTYQATVTETDNEGCSTALVFTGQTAYCNGSSVARATHPVTVGDNCPKVEGTASSFVPKLVSHHIVPGVRVRLAVNAPAHLEVKATLLWSKEGESGRANLGKVSVDVNHWRRLRLPIPDKLVTQLPLGTPVKVSLHIHATPRDSSFCAGNNTHPTLRVHVVKVIPDAVQSHRPR